MKYCNRWNTGCFGYTGATRASPAPWPRMLACAKARDALNASILKFRDIVNSDKGFTIYKTLVGFESVFPPAWDDPNFHYEQETAYRQERIDGFVAEVNDAERERMVRDHSTMRANGIR